MAKINFKEIEITDISGKKKVKGDGREEFADLIYHTVNGMAAHKLAHKIYESNGAVEYTEKEVEVILRTLEERCTPAFIDGIKKQLKTK